MIIAGALLMLAQAGAVPPDEVQADIVVMGKKLKNWRARMSADQSRCITDQSSGDLEIDAIGCAAMRICITQIQPQKVAATSRKLNANERKRVISAVYSDLFRCVSGRRDLLISGLAERRFQVRQERSK